MHVMDTNDIPPTAPSRPVILCSWACLAGGLILAVLGLVAGPIWLLAVGSFLFLLGPAAVLVPSYRSARAVGRSTSRSLRYGAGQSARASVYLLP